MSTMEFFAKMIVEGRGSMGLSRQDLEAAINKRAAETRRDGESDAQSFTRCILEDEQGRLLFKASRMVAPAEDAGDVDEVEEKPRSKGPAHDEMQALAELHAKTHPPCPSPALTR